MQGQVEVHLRQMREQLGLAIGSQSESTFGLWSVSTPKVPISKTKRTPRKGKGQPRKKRKSNLTDADTTTAQETDAALANLDMRTPGESSNIPRNDGDGSSKVDAIDVEQEFNDAFDELFDSV